MKKLKYLCLSVLAASVLLSCSKDDDKDDDYVVEYKSQAAQGLIGGVAFESVAAKFEDSPFDEGEYRIHIYNKADFDTAGTGFCGLGFYGTDYEVWITLPAEVGTHEFTSTGLYATLVDAEIPTNTALPSARKGAVEIVSINDSILVGKIDAYIDAENYVNGTFTAHFCAD